MDRGGNKYLPKKKIYYLKESSGNPKKSEMDL